MTRWKAVGLHVAFIVAIYWICPVATSGDSMFMVPVALNIIHHGSTTVDASSFETQSDKRIEKAPNGLFYAKYPIAVAAISVPLVLVLDAVRRVARPFAASHVSSGTQWMFFRGDFAAAFMLVEMLEASFLVALAAGLQLLIGLEFLPMRLASFLTFVFAFATPAWATASRAMWNHTPALLMLMLAVYFLIVARRKEHYAAYAAIPLELAFMVRPSMAIPAVALTVYVAFHHRARFIRYLLLAMPLTLLFFAYNLHTRDHLFQSYFTDPGSWPPASWPQRFGLQLISPSRGLFIFCPVVAFSFWGMWLAWRKRWLFPLAPWLIALVAAHILLVSRYYWPGYAYGPRYFTETIPLFTLFLIPVLQALPRIGAAVFFAAIAWSVFVEARGATVFAVHEWNYIPTDIDRNTWRAWDWSDPQFLRGLH